MSRPISNIHFCVASYHPQAAGRQQTAYGTRGGSPPAHAQSAGYCPPHAWERWPPARSQHPLSSFLPTRDHYSRCCRVSRIPSRVYRFSTTKAGMSHGISDIHLLAASHDYKELERWARQKGGNRASKGLEDRRHGPKCANKAIMRREINDLTQKSKPKTKPNQSH
jgi:hypothetical protein